MRTIAFGLSLVLIFTIPWESVTTISGLGTASKAIGILTTLFWLLKVTLTRQIRRPHAFYILCFLFVFWEATSVLWSWDFERTASRAKTYWQLLILILMIWDLYTTPKAVRYGCQAYVLGGYVSLYSTIQMFLSGSVSSSPYVRYAAGLFDPNDLGLTLALGIPLAWYLANFKNRQSPLLRLINYCYIPLAMIGILLTASRTASLAMLPSFLFIIWSLKNLKMQYKISVLFFVLLSLIALQPLIPQSSLDRVLSTKEEASSGDFNGRIPIWKQGLKVYLDHTALGIGGNAYNQVIKMGKISDNTVAHNTYVSVLVEVGAIGFALFMAMFATSIYQSIRQPKLCSLWLTLLLTLSLGILTLTWESRKLTWLILSFPIISSEAADTNISNRIKKYKFHA